MTLKVGNDMKFYYNTGTNASPVWNLLEFIGDLTVDLTVNDAEVDLRVTNWLLNLPSKFTGGFTVALANHIGNTHYNTIRGYFFARTVKQYASANAAIATSGTQFFKAFCYWNRFPWNQPTQEVSSHDAGLALAYEEESSTLVEPAWGTTA